MDLNSIAPQAQQNFTPREPTAPQPAEATAATSTPSTVPTSDGVYATFSTQSPAQEGEPDQPGDSPVTAADSDTAATPAADAPPTNDVQGSASGLPSSSQGSLKIKIEVDPTTNETYFKVLDRDTDELLREIPDQDRYGQPTQPGSVVDMKI